jgi:RimJ/RimL family protein N-acetyltransferase
MPTDSPTPLTIRRLLPEDAEAFRAVRLEGFARHPRLFRVAVEDEADQPLEAVAERLAREYVVGAYLDGTLVGVGGLTRYAGAKLRHKALLWGMYVREAARGRGAADGIIDALLARARADGLALVVLTVAADNARARRVYERWGFELYGVEPRAIREGDDYLDEALMAKRLDAE